jgi:hypothetical protein
MQQRLRENVGKNLLRIRTERELKQALVVRTGRHMHHTTSRTGLTAALS